MIFSEDTKDEEPAIMDLLNECLQMGNEHINIVEGDLI